MVKRRVDSLLFIRCKWYKRQNTKTIQGHHKGSEGPNTNIFELLILVHDRAYVYVESDESMCVMIMKYTIQLPEMAFDILNMFNEVKTSPDTTNKTLSEKGSYCSENMRANIAKNLF